MKLHELLRTERLKLAAVGVPPDALEREVSGAYITDLPDPSRFLSVGDIVLTSGMWLGGPDAVDSFVGALVRQRVVALVVGLVHLGHVPDEILEACRSEGLALLTISDTVSFKQVVEFVSSSQVGSSDGLAQKALQFSRRLAEVVAHGDGPEAVLREFHDEFAVSCWVVDAIGTLVAVAGRVPPKVDVGRVWNAMLGADPAERGVVVAAERARGSDDSPAVHTCWPIVGADGRVFGYFVCEGNQRRVARDTPIIVDSVVGALRVDLEFAARWREHSHSHVSELVSVLAGDAVSPGEISARMRLEGLDPQHSTIVAVAEVGDHRFPAGAVLEMTYRLLAQDDVRVIGSVVEAAAVLLVNGPTVTDVHDALPTGSVEDLLPILGGRQLRIGISDARVGVGQLADALASARDRLAQLQSSEPIALAASSQLRTHRAILAQLSERARTSYARDVLRPLQEYDARHGADLVSTLRLFLANSGAWQESARQLHLHTNTLRYRMARVEELTGRSIASMEDRVDLFLALQIEDS